MIFRLSVVAAAMCAVLCAAAPLRAQQSDAVQQSGTQVWMGAGVTSLWLEEYKTVQPELSVTIRSGRIGIPLSVSPTGEHHAFFAGMQYHPHALGEPGGFFDAGIAHFTGFLNPTTQAYVGVGLEPYVYRGFLRPVFTGRLVGPGAVGLFGSAALQIRF